MVENFPREERLNGWMEIKIVFQDARGSTGTKKAYKV